MLLLAFAVLLDNWVTEFATDTCTYFRDVLKHSSVRPNRVSLRICLDLDVCLFVCLFVMARQRRSGDLDQRRQFTAGAYSSITISQDPRQQTPVVQRRMARDGGEPCLKRRMKTFVLDRKSI